MLRGFIPDTLVVVALPVQISNLFLADLKLLVKLIA